MIWTQDQHCHCTKGSRCAKYVWPGLVCVVSGIIAGPCGNSRCGIAPSPPAPWDVESVQPSAPGAGAE